VTLRNQFFKSGNTKLKGGNIIVNIKEREFFFFTQAKTLAKAKQTKRKKEKWIKKSATMHGTKGTETNKNGNL
jgi:hypothetical protein